MKDAFTNALEASILRTKLSKPDSIKPHWIDAILEMLTESLLRALSKIDSDRATITSSVIHTSSDRKRPCPIGYLAQSTYNQLEMFLEYNPDLLDDEVRSFLALFKHVVTDAVLVSAVIKDENEKMSAQAQIRTAQMSIKEGRLTVARK